jgi:hypothetical protein
MEDEEEDLGKEEEGDDADADEEEEGEEGYEECICMDPIRYILLPKSKFCA